VAWTVEVSRQDSLLDPRFRHTRSANTSLLEIRYSTSTAKISTLFFSRSLKYLYLLVEQVEW
jgi:hypothetical protein